MTAPLGDINSILADGVRCFRLSGEFDLSNVADTEESLRYAIAHEDHEIVIDLSAVTFMDPRLVEALERVRAGAEATGHHVSFVPPLEEWLIRAAGMAGLRAA